MRIPPDEDKKEKTKVAVSVAGTINDNYRIIKDEMVETAKKEDQEIIWMEAQNNVLKQEADIKKAVDQKVKVIIIEPVDPEVLTAAIAEVQDQGIMIICVGSLPRDVTVEAFISPDYEKAGLLQGNQLLKEFEGTEALNVLILRGSEGSSAADKIQEGNRAVLKEGERIKKIWWEELSSWDEAKAYDLAKSYLQGSVKPQAIVAHSAELTAGAIKAVEDTKNSGKVKVFGMGTEVTAIEAIKKGVLTSDIDFMPEMLARVIMEAAESLSEDEPWSYEEQVENGIQSVPARYTPLRAITSENISLLKEREKKLKEGTEKQGSKNNADSKKGEGEQNPGGSQEEGSQQGEEKKTVVKIKTKDGQTFEMNITGEVESIEVKDEESQEEETKENQKQ